MHLRHRLKWILSLVTLAVVVFAAGFWVRPLRYHQDYARLRMFFSGARSEFLAVKGIRMHYYVVGPVSGSPVVLIHGLGGRSEDWMQLTPYLAHAGYRVYLPDLPGYGRSEQPVNFSYSVSDQGDVVLAYMAALGLKQVNLGGWSMGGWIVQRIAAAHPERVRKLMLFDSAGLYAKPNWDTDLFTPRNARDVSELDALLMPHPPSVPPFVARDIVRYSNNRAWVIHRALSSMLTGREVTDQLLPQLKMPVLIVWGEVDRITPLALGKKMHALILQSQLDVIPGCGHLAPNQCTAQIGPEVVAFLRNQGKRPQDN